ncbi:MAG: translation initiation factor IF-2 [Sphingobacteriales bacterium UTBCD1]|jgi:translation initiation factor IF-2|nr:MAG: translation initiation factor IF-2 [Sphingobacteriales bacterium UTBCD1]
MAELKLPRLLGAAKEFNIGQDTLIDFLIDKGFLKDDLKPTSKLTEEMYRALQMEFQSDKVAKMKSDQVDLPKGAQAEPKKKKEDEEIIFKKDEKKTVKKEEPPLEEKPAKLKTKKEEPPKEELIKVEAPELEKPKVVDKIDLSAIDSSTRPRKTGKKKKEEPEAKEPAKKTAKKKTAKEEEPVIKEKTEEPKEEPAQEELPPVIENIEVEKLTGPKVIGKIELPVDSDTRPKKEEKRKRKRIPIEKKEVKKEELFKDREKRQGGGFHRDDRRDRRGGGRRDNRQREEKQIDEKEIQEKIRQTQAKLAGGGGRGKSLKAKLRREKRHEMTEAMGEAETDHKLKVTEFISVSELANLMDVSFAEVISKCMSLGIMVSINQRLDAEVIELVASEFGYDVEFIDMEKHLEMEEQEDEDSEEMLKPRSPIVTIMGHVDHGKTSLLDYIRNANVVAGEAGGITQHIGAYRVTLSNGKEITFLDTPGHEAFTAMRARGAKVTDIAVIVIAADDAVMPQTREAISHAQAAGVPMIFAVNKIDKDGANPQKIYEQLSQMNLLVEEWGGKYQSQEISAKKGLNIDLLLEKVLLEAELLNLKANPDKVATGTIIEASLDKGRGYVATLLVENGTLRTGDLVVSGQYYGRVKAMFNERNKKQDEAGPSCPALILGLNGAPQAGEKFKVYLDESEAKEIANRRAQILREQGIRARKHITLDEIGRRLALGNFKELNIIIKGDVDGSVEALSDSLQKLSTQEILVNVIHKGVGQINESDVVLAEASDAVIIGFNVRPSLQASRLAENAGIQIRTYSIIYNAIEEVKSAMEGMLEPTISEKIVANVEIREVFKFDKAVVAGCYVRDGKIKRDSRVRLIRNGIVIYPVGEGASAELGSLKRFKDDAKEVQAGMECGLTIKNYSDIKVGDEVEAYEEEEVKRTL